MTTPEETIARIARETLEIDTLETRRSDWLDFHNVAVWSVKEALAAAYEAGRQAPPPTRAVCPRCKADIETRPL